ncbi:MAG: hypothetical protein A2Y62_19505 [Candidatus Fischerbacteria bacterium RBG_13_37_8]|uniref:SLH domain-containing protein n=1 Tax=Candidatus Fischerbacteria bacterium RBG_13_37_8 TaxID=1817863 RepID=A0A1F5VXK6_9BACT|nr:MAG: hypothetical protein A2Y62_19505 [Candidatus Fischerbacteria bacterium RBG_13_37_8]
MVNCWKDMRYIMKCFLTGLVICSVTIILISSAMANGKDMLKNEMKHALGEKIHKALTFEERISCQSAIEKVYWDHRIWPGDNMKPKPGFHEIINESILKAKAEDTLRKTNALFYYYKEPVTAQQLQAEMNRMALRTREAKVLKELLQVLNNDARLVAECLARPVLVERLIRNWYAFDERFHGELKQRAEADIKRYRFPEQMNMMRGIYTKVKLVRGDAKEDSAWKYDNMQLIHFSEKEWQMVKRFMENNPGNDNSSRLNENEESYYLLHFTQPEEASVTVEAVVWHKQNFDSWWSANKERLSAQIEEPVHEYSMPEVLDDSCVPDTWETISNAPEVRYGHTAVWTGTEMIIWGGLVYDWIYLNTGGRYNPVTDSWVPTSIVEAPAGRMYHTAVWAGSEMIIWGGDAGQPYEINTGGRYNPVSDSWIPTSTENAPSARIGHKAIWTGSEMIIWDGDGFGSPKTGGRYNPLTDSWIPITAALSAGTGNSVIWTGSEMIIWGGMSDYNKYHNKGYRYNPSSGAWLATSLINAPSPRQFHTAVWTGTEMIIWGGENQTGRLNDGSRYDPDTDSWSTITSVDAPEQRLLHIAIWSDIEMIVWGGFGINGMINTGGKYNPATDAWTATTTINAPAPRYVSSGIWSGSELIIWGGYQQNNPSVNNGARYNPVTDSWLPTSYNGAPTARMAHSAAWTGVEMIIWGGFYFSPPLFHNNGARYMPATDSWLPVTQNNAPISRNQHKTVWTGAEMIIWGGSGPGNQSIGGRYNPVSDSWTATSLDNVPEERWGFTAVWDGNEMIVWGGSGASQYFDSGSKYNPVTDAWTPTSTANVLSPRASHTAVWTGTEMIIWGGYLYDEGYYYYNDGRKYFPASDTWIATSLTDAPPERAGHTAIWTGNEMIVWGGQNDISLLSGSRYYPVTDSWLPTSTIDEPYQTTDHTAVWSVDEMIVWGGMTTDKGGRYDPIADIWEPTTLENAPVERYYHTAIWTSKEMIIWGGINGILPLNSGVSYCSPYVFLESQKPVVDDSSSSIPNGIIEENEQVQLIGTITNTGTLAAQSVQGTLATVDPIIILDGEASYPDIEPAGTEQCVDCYEVAVPGANRPATHWDVTVTEIPICSGCPATTDDFTYHIGNSFLDVPPTCLFYSFIEVMLHNSVSDGCASKLFCPSAMIQRQAIAKLLCNAMNAGSPGCCVVMPYCQGIFADVQPGNPFCPFIESLYNLDITSGCTASPLNYCPYSNMNRQAVAKFLCKAMESCEPGSCPMLPCTGIFDDVLPDNPYCSSIEALYDAGIISGCSTSPKLYCPGMYLTREQLSKLLANAFELSL